MNKQIFKLLLATMLVSGLANAEESGFLDDYSILGSTGEYGAARMYVSDSTIKRMADYGKIMIDQPLIYLDPESKSKGMKPDTMTSIAEMLRAAVTEGIGGQYEVVDKKGEELFPDNPLFGNWETAADGGSLINFFDIDLGGYSVSASRQSTDFHTDHIYIDDGAYDGPDLWVARASVTGGMLHDLYGDPVTADFAQFGGHTYDLAFFRLPRVQRKVGVERDGRRDADHVKRQIIDHLQAGAAIGSTR